MVKKTSVHQRHCFCKRWWLDTSWCGGRYWSMFVIEEVVRACMMLRDPGHSVLVDKQIWKYFKFVDWIIDLGPASGLEGGRWSSLGGQRRWLCRITRQHAFWKGNLLPNAFCMCLCSLCFYQRSNRAVVAVICCLLCFFGGKHNNFVSNVMARTCIQREQVNMLKMYIFLPKCKKNVLAHFFANDM